MVQSLKSLQKKDKAPSSVPSAGPSAAPPAAAGAGGGLRTQLKSMNYAAGAAAVQPKKRNSGEDVGGPGDAYDTPQQLDDPELARDDKTKKRETHEYKRMEGRLFVRGVRAQDVMQGYLADCYFAAALSSVAQRHPGEIKDAITPMGGDVYQIRFYDVDWDGTAKAQTVTVDADFPWYQNKNTWAYLQSTQKGELWPALMEKAWAIFKGGGGKGDYDKVGQGGYESDVMEAITGRLCDYHDVKDMEDDDLWATLKKAADNKQAVTAGTYSAKKGKDGKADPRYTGTGIYDDHAYTVMGVKTKGRGKNKKRFVILRNPWAEGEPTGDGKDDGIFECPLDTFKKSYEALTILE